MRSLLLLLLPLTTTPYLHHAAAAEAGPHGYHCEPARPVFCRNIHVACAGRTGVPAVPFRVSIDGAVARLDFDGPEPSVHGKVTESGDLVIRLENSRSWIRIRPDGRYSHRIYRKGGAAMSQGTCRSAPSR